MISCFNFYRDINVLIICVYQISGLAEVNLYCAKIGQGKKFSPEIPVVFWLNRDAWPGIVFILCCVYCVPLFVLSSFLFFYHEIVSLPSIYKFQYPFSILAFLSKKNQSQRFPPLNYRKMEIYDTHFCNKVVATVSAQL